MKNNNIINQHLIKTFNMKAYILLSLLCIIAFSTSAQINYIDELMHAEKKHFTQKMNFKPSAFANTNDIFYHRINWKVDPAVNYIEGNVTSYFKILKDQTDAIYFDLSEPLTVDSVLHRTGKLSFTHTNSVIQVNFPTKLNINDVDSLTVFYKGAPKSEGGFSSFIIDKHNDVPVLWTLSEPYGAKDWWPCKQDLIDKIDSLDIFVTVPTGNKVGSNGVLISETTLNNKTTCHWKHKHPIVSYLVAIATTNYAAYSDFATIGDGKQVEILNYVYPENETLARTETKYTVDVLELYSKLFIPYPFADEKYGHAQFGWGGGMEHQTMSFMVNFSKDLIAHELAHQWYGDHVTCGSWEDIWINEGFATYLTGLTYEHLNPENWMNWKYKALENIINNAREGSVIVDDTTDIYRIFSGTLSYKKGSYVLHMLRNQIGDDAFYEGMNLLLTDESTSGGFASTKQVQEFFETAGDTNLTDFFDQMLYKQGYPVFKVEWLQNADQSVDIKLIQTPTHESVSCFKLHVPVLFRGEGKEKLISFHQTKNNQSYSFNPGFEVNKVIFDPELNIMAPHPSWTAINVQKNELASQLSIFPNPATDKLIIKTNKQSIAETIDIISVDGKNVYSFENNSHQRKMVVNISNFKPGVYFIRAIISGKEVTKQFIKD